MLLGNLRPGLGVATLVRIHAVGLALAAASLAVAPEAEAKFRIALALSDPTPTVGQRVSVVIRADVRPEAGLVMRLLAVPPGVGLYAALRREDRFSVPLVRKGAVWRGTVRFRRPGRWRLVVPNWGAPGYAMPPPVVRLVPVRPP